MRARLTVYAILSPQEAAGEHGAHTQVSCALNSLSQAWRRPASQLVGQGTELGVPGPVDSGARGDPLLAAG